MRTKKIVQRDLSEVSFAASQDAPGHCCACGRVFGRDEARFRFGPLPGERYAVEQYPYADVCTTETCIERYRDLAWNGEQPASAWSVPRARARRGSRPRKAA